MKFFSRPILLAALAIILVAAGVAGGPANPIDAMVIRETAQWRLSAPGFTQFVRSFTDVGGAAVTLSATALGTLFLLVKRFPVAALLLPATVIVERLTVDQLKDWIDRPRPALEPLWHLPQSMAFPSGHAANSMTAFVAVAVIATAARWRWAACVAAVILSLLVGLSRVYLGVHWPSDVIGGWAFGLLAVAISMAVGRRSGGLPFEPKHDVIGRHLPSPCEDKAS